MKPARPQTVGGDQGYALHGYTASRGERYTLQVHTDGGGKGYGLYVRSKFRNSGIGIVSVI